MILQEFLQLQVTFDIDANGILTVSAKDKNTGKSQEIKISGSSGLSDSEIEKMVKDAELHKEEDMKRKEVIELRNQADSMAHQTQKMLDENKANVGNADEIQKAIDELKEVAKNENATKEQIESKLQALSQVAQSLAQSAQANQQNAGAQSKKDDDVIDAEVE